MVQQWQLQAALGSNTSFTRKAGNICSVVRAEKRNHRIEINAFTLRFVKALEQVDVKHPSYAFAGAPGGAHKAAMYLLVHEAIHLEMT